MDYMEIDNLVYDSMMDVSMWEVGCVRWEWKLEMRGV